MSVGLGLGQGGRVGANVAWQRVGIGDINYPTVSKYHVV
jgi:hypothetical protein